MMQQNTDDIWRYMQLQVVMDYSRRPVLPPPFILSSRLSYLSQVSLQEVLLVSEGQTPCQRLL